MSKLYGNELNKYKIINLDCKFHELWDSKSQIIPIEEIHKVRYPYQGDETKITGVYMTFNAEGFLVRCGIKEDIFPFLRQYCAWSNECYFSYNTCYKVSMYQLREYKQNLRRMKDVSNN